MDRLNYFAPFQSKLAGHEDQLTRAFLVVLRYVPLAQAASIDLLRERAIDNLNDVIPPISGLVGAVPSFQTQVSTISKSRGRLLSVLLSDETWTPTRELQFSARGARYDGVITYGLESNEHSAADVTWIIVIENKPWSAAIWEGQSNPSEHSIAPDAEIELCKEGVGRFMARADQSA